MIGTKTKIAVLYAAFAAVAMGANLGTQIISSTLYHGPWAIELSILVGTLVGLPVKYVLDKMYIFRFKANNLGHDTRLFILYSLMAVVTTLIFWGLEGAFQVLFGTETMRLIGGALGLTVGYIIKYQLDKKFVFTRSEGGS